MIGCQAGLGIAFDPFLKTTAYATVAADETVDHDVYTTPVAQPLPSWDLFPESERSFDG